MKKTILLIALVGLIASSCGSGHKSQSWHPRTGKTMKKGHNNK